MIKYRVVDENGKWLAIESIHDAKWWYCNVVTVAGKDSVEPWQLGTYPGPGKRLAFTGKLDKHGREIYDQTWLRVNLVMSSVLGSGRVFWDDDKCSWSIRVKWSDDDQDCDSPDTWDLGEWPSDNIEVITSETD